MSSMHPWPWLADIANASPEPERVEIRGGDARIKSFGLVDREQHGLAGAVQLARNE